MIKSATGFAMATALMTALSSTSAFAAPLSRCQCNYDRWVHSCVATVSNQKGWAKITSDTQQCSRVDWYIDGNPQMTIVTNGVETEALLNVKSDSKLVVQACNVCQDEMFPDGSAAPAAGVQGNPTTSSSSSLFAGTWIAHERNVFGFSSTTTMQLTVLGTTISGTWDGQAVTGTISGSSATIDLSGSGVKGMTLRLDDPTTMSYSTAFFSGTLKKAR
jgi:hypothetical protein